MVSIANTQRRGTFAFALIVLISSSLGVAAVPNIKHQLLISGTGLDYVGIVDSTGKLIWKHVEIESGPGNGQKNDSWLLPNGNIVYAYQWGVRIVNTKTNLVVWDHPTAKRAGQTGETHSCQPLDSGSSKFLVGESFNDTSFVVEVDTTGREWRRIALIGMGSGTHGQFRQIRKTPQRTYLVSSYSLHLSFEYDSTGHLVHQFPAGGYMASRLDNGNTLIATGDDMRVVEYAGGAVVWEVNNTSLSISTVSIGFASEALRLPDGNSIVTNWGGHGTGYGAAVVEMKSDRTIVGAVPDSFPARISSVKVIDNWTLSGKQTAIALGSGANGSISPQNIILVAKHGTLTLTLPSAGATRMQIFDCLGTSIASKTYQGPGHFTFSNASLSEGVYFICLKDTHSHSTWFRKLNFRDNDFLIRMMGN
jgi:uncharacterized spore protein YtfJ